MYIGAWTEYRLAQEQVHIRRQNAGQSVAGASGTTWSSPHKGAGIYHPSLSDKGGMAVAGLPDREVFRRTLESALSSNLAADDAESISQALEPLMQRLPTIHAPPAAPALAPAATAPTVSAMPQSRRQRRKTLRSMGRMMQPVCRQQKRKSGGHQNWEALNRHTRSDAGTRSAAEPTSDGTRSTQSGFSAASAPLNTCAGLGGSRGRPVRLDCGTHISGVGFGGQHMRGRPCGGSRGPQLPVIMDTRRRRRNSHGSSSGSACSGNTCRARSYQGTSSSIDPAETCPEGDTVGISSGGNSRTLTSAPAGTKKNEGHYEEHLAKEGGGYDGGAAATILRVARKRDPVGLNANFEQFWTWARRPAATAIDSSGKRGTQPTQNKTPRRSTQSAARGGNAAAASKLENLARMKAVYMTKEDSNSGDEYTAATTTATSPRKCNPPCRPLHEPRSPDRSQGVTQTGEGTGYAGWSTTIDSTTGETDNTLLQSRDRAEGWAREEGMTKPAADATTQSNFDQNKAIVDVPDLDLTESRIRQVDKYFGGSGGAERHRRPADEVKYVGKIVICW